MRKLAAPITLLSIPSLFWGGNYAEGVLNLSHEEPPTYAEGAQVLAKVNKMTSTKTQLGIEYYRLPWCHPAEGRMLDKQNFGQFLGGDRIESSPYRIQMKKDAFCEQLCISNLGRGESKGLPQNKVVRAIRENYHNNWLMDGLPAASRLEDDLTITTKYWGGFPIGFVATDTKKAYINNHVNLQIQYHRIKDEQDKYRVVRFTVQPFSIEHKFEILEDDNQHTDDDYEGDQQEKKGDANEGSNQAPFARIINPIVSCSNQSHWATPRHTDYDMIYTRNRSPQLASGRVLFTYDVIWYENKDLHWSNRWDIYVSMDNAIPDKVHWFSIFNSIVVLVILVAVTACTVSCTQHRSLPQYNQVHAADTNESGSGIDEPLVGIQEPSPEPLSLLILAVLCGSGAQLLVTTISTMILCFAGVLGYSKRGSFIIGIALMYVICGLFGGFTVAQHCEAFSIRGARGKWATVLAACLLPSLSYGFFLGYLTALQQGSTSIPPSVIWSLVIIFAANIVTVSVGSHFGHKLPAANMIFGESGGPLPRRKRCMYILTGIVAILGGVLPFSAMFVELYFTLGSIFLGQYYGGYGFGLVAFVLAAMTCAIAAFLCALLAVSSRVLHAHQVWWCSFLVGGSCSGWLLLYSEIYRQQLEIDARVYSGCMILASIGLLLMMGYIGVLSTQWMLPKVIGPSLPASGQQSIQPFRAGASRMGYMPPMLGGEEIETLSLEVDDGEAAQKGAGEVRSSRVGANESSSSSHGEGEGQHK